MARLQPLPENIPLLDTNGITRRWIGWLRTIQQKLSLALDTEVLQAFASINAVDPQIAEDQARLSVFGGPVDRSAELDDLGRLLAAMPSRETVDLSSLEKLLAFLPGLRAWSEIAVLQDTAANAGLYPAAAYVPGSLRRETDTVKLFMQLAGAWVQLIAPAFLPFLSAAATHGALKRDGAGLSVRVGDDSADGFLKVLDEAYGSGWNGKIEVPTKNAVYDKIESLATYGSWTPTLSFGGGTTGLTYSYQQGTYEKLVTASGTWVRATGALQLSAKGSSTGVVVFDGLPFALQNAFNQLVPVTIYGDNLTGVSGHLQAFGNVNETKMYPYYLGTGSGTQWTDANFNNNSVVLFSIHYKVA